MKNTKHYIKTLFNRALLCLCALFLLFVSACSKNSSPAAPGNTPLALLTAAPEKRPAPGGELKIPIPRNPFKTDTSDAANPLLVNTEEMLQFYQLIYEPLLRCDANNRLIPSLAEKWSADDTGRVWTISLRENVVWHIDGTPLDADDIIYTIGRILSLSRSYYNPSLFAAIEAYERVDDLTVRITMKSPGTASLYALVFPVVCADDISGQLNGTGPYLLKSATGSAIELTPNPRWWRQAPYLQSIRCLQRESNDVSLDSYEAGQLNFVPTNTVSAGKYREEGVTNVLDLMTQNAEVLLLNYNNRDLRELSMRQAIAYALDRGQIISNVYMNRMAVSDVPVPPDSFLYCADSKTYNYDMGAAAALLASAGWTERNEDGILMKGAQKLHFRLLVNESTESTYRKSAASMIQSQLARVGIEVEIVIAKLSIGGVSEFESMLASGSFDMALAGFHMDRGGNLSPYLLKQGARNYGKYPTSDDMEALMRAASLAIDEKDMREAHFALQKAFVDELPFIMLGFRMSSIIHSAKIQNITDIRGTDVFRTIRHWYTETIEE